jgi:hypothetical protein
VGADIHGRTYHLIRWKVPMKEWEKRAMTMFGVLQRYDPKREVVENFIDHLNSNVVPVVTRVPGSYCPAS